MVVHFRQHVSKWYKAFPRVTFSWQQRLLTTVDAACPPTISTARRKSDQQFSRFYLAEILTNVRSLCYRPQQSFVMHKEWWYISLKNRSMQTAVLKDQVTWDSKKAANSFFCVISVTFGPSRCDGHLFYMKIYSTWVVEEKDEQGKCSATLFGFKELCRVNQCVYTVYENMATVYT